MPERWLAELRKLRMLDLPGDVPQPKRDAGVIGPSRAQRVLALAVALTVFAGAALIVWQAFGSGSNRTAAPGHDPSIVPSRVSFPDVGRISCTKKGTHIRTPLIQPQKDGVHVRVNNVSGGEWIQFESVRRSPMTVGNDWDRGYRIHRTKSRELVILAGPGVGLVSCSPGAHDRFSSAPGGFDSLEIVDPQGFWGPPDLACSRSDAIRFDVHGVTTGNGLVGVSDREIRANLGGLLDSDDVRLAGYPHAQEIWRIGPWHVVVRDGESIASVWFWQVDGAATVNTCPDSGITRPGHPWIELGS
jgi:hypothetical protein